MKETVFITKQGVKIKRKDNQIVAFLKDEKVWSFPINRVKNVFIFGNIEISMPAINFLLSKDADIYLLSNTGKFKGIITNAKLESNYAFRLKQYRAFLDEDRRLKLAKFFVLKKLEKIENFTDNRLSDLKFRLKETKSYNEVLGIEGTASAYFFARFKDKLSKKNLGFGRREYYPAKDPVNATLSLVYSLFYGLLFSVLQSKGFDPYISFLHRKRGTHASFVSDFMEIFRVDLSNFVLAVFNRGILKKEDFEFEKNGCYLKNEKLKDSLEIFKQNFIDNGFFLTQTQKAIDDFLRTLGENR